MGYNPSATFDPGIITRGFENISGMITQFAEQRKKDADEATMLRKLAELYDPDNKDVHKTKSLAELRAGFKAFGFAEEMKDREARRKREDVERQMAEKQLAEAQRQQQAQEHFQQRMTAGQTEPGATLPVQGELQQPAAFGPPSQTTIPTGPMSFAGPIQIPSRRRDLNPAETIQAWLQAGGEPAQADNLARAQHYVAAGPGKPELGAPDLPPQEINIGGVPYVWKPGSQSYGPRADFTVSRRHENALDLAEFKKSLEGAPAGAYIGEQNGALVVFKADGSLWKPISQANIFNMGGGGGGATATAGGAGSRPREFKSEAEALKSGVKGEVIINGKRARID